MGVCTHIDTVHDDSNFRNCCFFITSSSLGWPPQHTHARPRPQPHSSIPCPPHPSLALCLSHIIVAFPVSLPPCTSCTTNTVIVGIPADVGLTATPPPLLARSAEGLAPKGSGQESCRLRRRSPRAGRTLGPRFGSPGSPGRLLTMSALSRGLASRTRRSTKTSQTQSASLRCRIHLPHLCTALRSCAFTLLKYEGSLRHSSANISLLDHTRSVGSHGIVALLHPLSISLLSH